MLATQSQDKLKNDVIIIISCNHEINVIIIERARIEKILLGLQKMEYFQSEGPNEKMHGRKSGRSIE